MGVQDEASSKILDKDVIRRPDREFFATFAEWVADGNAEQIIRQIGTPTSGGTIYSIPKNFTLFITAACISITCTSGAPSQRIASIQLPDGQSIIQAAIQGGFTAFSNAVSFPMPIRATSGNITTQINANAFGNFIIIGFLLPKKISIR